MRWNKQMQWIHLTVGIILILSVAGCNRDETKVYQVPKDSAPPQQSAPDATPTQAAPPDMAPPPNPAAIISPIKYQLPEGWQEKPASDMRVASFTAAGPNGQTADISVIPLPVVGRDLELINMWRSRVQLPSTTDPHAAKQFEPVTIGAEQGRLFEFVSAASVNSKGRQRLLVAILTHDSMSWFFKITGDDQYVISQKKHFLQFLKSVSFVDNAPPGMEAASSTQDEGISSASIWSVPSSWQSVPPSQFLLAEYSLSGANGAKAEVNVAAMVGEGGGLLPNVNRWRGQIGLKPISENELSKPFQALDVPGGKATLVDFEGIDAKTNMATRLIGAIVSEKGQTWFYKLMGDKQVVAQEKDNFIKFIQSANYANAR